MNASFSPGDVIVSSRPSMVGESWAKYAFLVIEAKRLNQDGQFTERWRQAGWILTVMKLDGSSEVVTTYFDSDIWATVATLSGR